MEYINQDDANLFQNAVTHLKRFSALDDHQWAVAAHFLFFTYLHDHQDIWFVTASSLAETT